MRLDVRNEIIYYFVPDIQWRGTFDCFYEPLKLWDLVRDFVCTYDFVSFTETFSADFPSYLFSMYDVLILCIKHILPQFVCQVALLIDDESDNCIVLQLCKRFTELAIGTGLNKVFTMLELKLAMASVCLNIALLMCLKNTESFLSYFSEILMQELVPKTLRMFHCLTAYFPIGKDEHNVEEQQTKVNDFITNDIGLHCLSTVIDYFIVSTSLVQFCIHLNVIPKIESKHMPVEMKLRISRTLMTDYKKHSTFKIQKNVWDHT